MKIKQTIIYLILLTGLVFSIYVLWITLFKNEWNTVASSLAVITAIISAWSAQRIILKQEEELEPKLIAYFDVKSRFGLTLFVIENIGGGTAYNVKIKWEKPLLNNEEKEIHFRSGKENIDFYAISKGQKYYCFVHGTSNLYEYWDIQNEPVEFWGELYYKKRKNSWFETKDDFFISLEPYRDGLRVDDEQLNFFHESAKIHNDLKEINKTLSKITEVINTNEKPKC